jgi:hypothetical protein
MGQLAGSCGHNIESWVPYKAGNILTTLVTVGICNFYSLFYRRDVMTS